MSLLCHFYIIITNGKSGNNDSIITCYAKSKPHYYIIIIHCYFIITNVPIITHYYIFQSPFLADMASVLIFSTKHAFFIYVTRICCKPQLPALIG